VRGILKGINRAYAGLLALALGLFASPVFADITTNTLDTLETQISGEVGKLKAAAYWGGGIAFGVFIIGLILAIVFKMVRRGK